MLVCVLFQQHGMYSHMLEVLDKYCKQYYEKSRLMMEAVQNLKDVLLLESPEQGLYQARDGNLGLLPDAPRPTALGRCHSCLRQQQFQLLAPDSRRMRPHHRSCGLWMYTVFL